MALQEAIESLSGNIALHFAYGNVFSHYEKTTELLSSFRFADGGDLKSCQDNHEL